MTADEKYAVLNRDNLTIPIQMQLSQKKKKTFSIFFAAYLKSRLNFEHFEKETTLIDFVIPKVQTPKSRSDKCLKSPVSEDTSTSNMVNVPKDCWNLHDSTFIIFIDHCQVNWVGKGLSYWRCQILELLVSTLAAHEKYPALNRENLTISIQMELTQKKGFFLKFLEHFWNLV